MKTKSQIISKLCEVESDERLHYPNANITINAPLALIQLVLETKRDLLKWILEDA